MLTILKIEFPCDLAISLLVPAARELKAESGRDVCTPVFTAAIITTAKRWR